jgi:hypothetical protein
LNDCVIVLNAADATLLPFIKAMSSSADWRRPNKHAVFVLKFTVSSVNGLTGGVLQRFLAVLRSDDSRCSPSTTTVEYHIDTDAMTQTEWSIIADSVSGGGLTIDHIRCTEGLRWDRRSISTECLAALAQVESFTVEYQGLEHPIMECARTMFDETANVYSTTTTSKFQRIAQKCKHLDTLILTHMSCDCALVNNGLVLRDCMKFLDDMSSLKKLRLRRHALVAPSVITALRQMARWKSRADLTVGIVVKQHDESIYAMCAELIRRYLLSARRNDVVFEIKHPNAQLYRMMTHAKLLDELHLVDPCVHDAWSMLRQP